MATSWALLLAQEPDAATSPAQVHSLIEAGRYEHAEAASRLLLSAAQTRTGSASLSAARASDLLVESLLLNGKGAQKSTRELAESTLRLKEGLLDSHDVELVSTLRNLANSLRIVGQAKQSLPLLERALTIHEHSLEAEGLATAETLDDTGRAQLQVNQYDEAERSLARALAIKERSLESNDIQIARTLEGMALLHQNKGDYPGARPFLERALRIRESVGPDHPEMVETLNLLGSQFWFEGADPHTERDQYLRALTIAQRSLRLDHPLIAITFRNLGIAAKELGDFAESRRLRERALSIAESNYGASDSELGNYVNDLANINVLEGDYIGARVLYERALRIAELGGGPDDALATCLYNLGNVYGYLGDFAESRRYFDRAITIWQRASGKDHPYVAVAISALAVVLFDQNHYAEARAAFERALKIQERSLGPDHRAVSQTLADLAATLERQGSLLRARTLSSRAVSILERSNAQGSPAFAKILTRHANLEVTLGDFAGARRSYERALAIRARVVGTSHPLYAETHLGLATALAGVGNRQSATVSALEADATGRQHLRATLRYLPERASVAYAASRPKGLDLAISFAGEDAGTADRIFEALVKSRALVLDELAARRRVRMDVSTDIAPLWSALVSARQRLANLVVRGPNDSRPDQYLKLVDDARREKEIAERGLAEKSATFRDELNRQEIGLADVRAALPAKSALVAFARYDRTIITRAPAATASFTTVQRRALRRVPSYIAFVVPANGAAIAMIPLGPASTIDPLVEQWHQQATGVLSASSDAEAEQAYRLAGVALRTRIWDPLAAHLTDAATVFVVPDGTLNLVSFASLPAGRKSYLIDNGPIIHYLSAERDLVTSPTAPTSNRGLLAVGGAAFDDPTLFTGTGTRTSGTTGGSAKLAAAKTRSGCGDLQSLQFESLAETSDEVRDVARLWTDPPVQVLQNRNASERAFKEAAPGHRVLHLATHGFFLGSKCESASAATRGIGGLSGLPKPQANLGTADNPLLLSGLALAGANRRAAAGPNDEDGILTAEEVAGLNLEGVEWAVLSACRTGLGEVKIGEGVFGLRRAFQIAGVHTVIMSLWSVEDQSAREWMRALYEGRLKQNLSTAEAVQRASLTVLHARRSAKQSTHPFYWAGFVAAGDWR